MLVDVKEEMKSRRSTGSDLPSNMEGEGTAVGSEISLPLPLERTEGAMRGCIEGDAKVANEPV